MATFAEKSAEEARAILRELKRLAEKNPNASVEDAARRWWRNRPPEGHFDHGYVLAIWELIDQNAVRRLAWELAVEESTGGMTVDEKERLGLIYPLRRLTYADGKERVTHRVGNPVSYVLNCEAYGREPVPVKIERLTPTGWVEEEMSL